MIIQKVWLNGTEQNLSAITRFSTKEGWLERKVSDGKGGWKVDPVTHLVVKERVAGVVHAATAG